MNVDSNINRVVDELGELKARISDLKDQENGLKGVLLLQATDEGLKHFEGNLFKATVTFRTRKVVDYDSLLEDIRQSYGIDSLWLRDAKINRTTITNDIPDVRVVSKSSD